MTKPRHVIVSSAEWRVLTTLQQFGGSGTVASVARKGRVTDATVAVVMQGLRAKQIVSRVEVQHTGTEYYSLRKGVSVEVRFEGTSERVEDRRGKPPRARKGEPRKTKPISFWLTEAEKAQVEAAARANGLTLSEYIRERL